MGLGLTKRMPTGSPRLPQIRKLYYAAAVSLLPSDQAAVAAAGAEVQRCWTGLLEAQQAAISAAVMEEACK